MGNPDAWAELLARVALVVSEEWPEVTAQEISDYLREVVERTPQLDHQDDRTPGVLMLLGDEYASKRRAGDLSTSAQYAYRRSDVAALLEDTWDRSRWVRGYVPEDARTHRPEMDAVDVQADVTEALWALSKTQRYWLWRHYGTGDDSHPDLTADAMETLIDTLNRYNRRRQC